MAGVYGQYDHTVDAKGRMNFPAKFREYFGETFYITRSVQAECLMLRPVESWAKLEQTLEELPDDISVPIQRFVIGCACEVQPDKQGRVALSPALRKSAGIDTEVVVIGLGDRAEIWSSEKYYANQEIFDRAAIADLAKGLKL